MTNSRNMFLAAADSNPAHLDVLELHQALRGDVTGIAAPKLAGGRATCGLCGQARLQHLHLVHQAGHLLAQVLDLQGRQGAEWKGEVSRARERGKQQQ